MDSHELTVAREAAQAAAEVLRRHYRSGVALQSKAVANFVSEADLEAERAIAAVIQQHLPGHEILGEELHQGSTSAEHLWVVDPLDGTHNFAHKIPHFAVSIAYLHRGEAQLGIVLNPVTDTWHVAVKGQGATVDGAPVHVADHQKLDETIIAVGFPYDRARIMEATLAAMGDLIRREIHGIRRMGSAALDLCDVGLGRYGAYFEYQLSPWDFAAGQLFVTEAGGRVTTTRGEPVPLARTGVLASNGLLHQAVLEVIDRHHP